MDEEVARRVAVELDDEEFARRLAVDDVRKVEAERSRIFNERPHQRSAPQQRQHPFQQQHMQQQQRQQPSPQQQSQVSPPNRQHQPAVPQPRGSASRFSSSSTPPLPVTVNGDVPIGDVVGNDDDVLPHFRGGLRYNDEQYLVKLARLESFRQDVKLFVSISESFFNI